MLLEQLNAACRPGSRRDAGMRLYASTFGVELCPYVEKTGAIAVEAGAAGREGTLYPTRDDAGYSISEQNRWYGELTVLYWIWMNEHIGADEIVGFFHYGKGLWIGRDTAREKLGGGQLSGS